MVVVLPAPLGPSSATVRPRATAKLRSATAVDVAVALGQAVDPTADRPAAAASMGADQAHSVRPCSR